MTRHFSSKRLVGFSIFATLILFAFSGSHPTTGSGGYTGAPNDNVCTTCHTPGGSLDGTIEITGLPGTVTANTTYPLTVTVTNTAGSAVRAGFQMVSLKTNLANGGTFSVPVSENNASVKMVSGKSYVGHEPSKNFSANVASFDVEWTAPASATGDITLYAAAIIANGADGNSNDKFVATNAATNLGGGGDPLTATFSNIIDATCSDSNDGSATVNAMGGSGNYMYNWDNGETNATAVMLNAGNHSVTISDDSSNEIVENVDIGAPAAIVPSIIFQSDAVCNGEMSGTAELTATGGTPGYSYNWGGGTMGAIQNNLAAGFYVVTVSDINLCTAEINVTIDQPDPIAINIITQDEPSCNGDSDGTISVEATGGNGNFSYNWLDGIGIPNGGTLSSIPMGDYQVEVIDGEGCTNQTTITLGEPDAVTVTVSGTDVSCQGGADGTATAEGDGGSGNYTYNWSNGGVGATQNNLLAGTYFVTVSDEDNCEAVTSIEISEPDMAIEAGILIVTQPNCGNADGELSAFGNGGTPDYSYEWSTGATGAVLSGIGSGEYTVTVTDMNSCTASHTVLLEDNDGITLAANDVMNNDCPGGMEGSATISASGGTGMYSFAWSNGGANATENNLPAGDYTITVTDEGNCTGEITIEITEPDTIMANETLTHITCFDATNGSIQLAATGGTGMLSYLWNTGATEDGISDLIPGIFSVTITDENNCEAEFEFVIEEPDAIVTGDVMTVSPTCPGDTNGMITINPSGGTGDLSYLWSTGSTSTTIENLATGDYSVTITDMNACEAVFNFTVDDPILPITNITANAPTCNGGDDGSASLSIVGGTGPYDILWSTGDTTLNISGLTAGTYHVTVTDAGLCPVEDSVVIQDPLAIDPNITATNETSNGAADGTASADPMNGMAPYSFVWSTGDTTESIMDLAPGSYEVTITDANDCMVVGNAVINNGDCDLTAEVNLEHISCFGLTDGMISITLMGAVEPIEFEWSTGSTDTVLMDLAAGTYSLTLTDANNCQIQLTDMEIIEPDNIVATDTVITDASASDIADGSIAIEFNGGSGDLQVEYTDGEGNDIGLTGFDALMAGSYGAIVTDENGCSKFFGPFDVGVISSTSEIETIKAEVFPNPAHQHFTVRTASDLLIDPQVYTVSGRLLNIAPQKDGELYSFDASNLVNGVYYIKLVSKDDIALQKIIVAR